MRKPVPIITIADRQPKAMTHLIQSFLLTIYALVRRTGLLSTPLGEKCFNFSYEIYKSRLEARSIEHLRCWVKSGTCAIDVGANVGFFTRRFADWVGDSGRVISIEPEAQNLQQLGQKVSKLQLDCRVEVVQAVAADKSGSLYLKINPDHPGDHHIASEGVLVSAVTLDELMEARDWPCVSLVKIDVQGAEIRVLAGARRLLTEQAPALFLEIDPAALLGQHSTPTELLDFVNSFGYQTFLIQQDGALEAVSNQQILLRLETLVPYLDLLCVSDQKMPDIQGTRYDEP